LRAGARRASRPRRGPPSAWGPTRAREAGATRWVRAGSSSPTWSRPCCPPTATWPRGRPRRLSPWTRASAWSPGTPAGSATTRSSSSLDELILWLATHAGDLPFPQTEGPKLAKLVEHVRPLPVPVVSFVARRRDLREPAGDNLSGAEERNFADRSPRPSGERKRPPPSSWPTPRSWSSPSTPAQLRPRRGIWFPTLRRTWAVGMDWIESSSPLSWRGCNTPSTPSRPFVSRSGGRCAE